jgi:hypothetical protein
MPLGMYSGTYTTPQTLSSPFYNPATVTGTGVINVNTVVSGATGLLGPNPTNWTVVNQGTVQSIGNLGNGIILQAGGSVNNSGLVQGTGQGVQIQGAAGNIANTGNIAGAGTLAAGINLQNGGNITNGG